MKIERLKFKNFAKFTDFEVEFKPDVTRLVGVNGSGKTTVGLVGIWAALKGIAEKNKDGQLLGERFRFISPGQASADVELTLLDEKRNAKIKVRNHITKQGNNITFQAPEGYPIDGNWLNHLLSVTFMSAEHFTALNPKEQAASLGIDTTEYDKQISELKNDYTATNSVYRSLGDPPDVDKVEPVNVQDLLKEHKEATDFNSEQAYLAKRKDELKAEIADLKQTLKDLEKELAETPEPESYKDIESLNERIQQAEQINEQAREYNRAQEVKQKKADLKKQLEQNKMVQAEVVQEKNKYLQSFQFGFKGLEIDETGGLILDGRPIQERYFSKGELEIIVARLYAARDPEAKWRFIDNFESLDAQNQEKLLKDLLDKGFQIITAEVGTEKKGDNTILLKECKQVDKYDEKEQENLL